MKPKPNILVIYPVENDPQSVILYEELLNKGGRPRLLPFKMHTESGQMDISLSKEEFHFDDDLSEVRAVFVRGLSVEAPLAAPPYASRLEQTLWRARYIKENQRIHMMNQLLRTLESRGALIVNPLRTYFHHNTKVQLAKLFRSKGLPVPRTFGTNSSAYLNRRIRTGREFVMKSPCGVGATRKIDERHLNRKTGLRLSPALIQKRVNGSTVRVHTIGNKVILSLKIFAKDVDSRSDTAGFEVVKLRPEHEHAIIEANNLIGIHFSAWDIIIDEKDRLHLLDCNIGPYIFWIGSYFTRLFKAEAARYLVAYAETGSLEKADAAASPADSMIGGIHKTDKNAEPYVRHILHDWKAPLGLRH